MKIRFLFILISCIASAFLIFGVEKYLDVVPFSSVFSNRFHEDSSQACRATSYSFSDVGSRLQPAPVILPSAWHEGPSAELRQTKRIVLFSCRTSNGSGWDVYQEWPSGTLRVTFVGRKNGEDAGDVLVAGDNPIIDKLYPMNILATADKLYVIVYDVVRNIPSGRSLSVNEPGYDVFAFHFSDGIINLENRSKGIDIGGMDNMVYPHLKGSKIKICANNKCATIDLEGSISPKFWPLDDLSTHEFVEVAFGQKSTYAITRLSFDDRLDVQRYSSSHEGYFLVEFSDQGVHSIKPIPVRGIPYKLSVENGAADYNIADDEDSVRRLLRYELNRFRHNGLMSFGQNNLEGRIAWQQVRYINGLLSVASGMLPSLLDDALVSDITARLSTEITMLTSLAGVDVYYWSKRYSRDRRPILFALHLGRIISTLERAKSSGLVTSLPRAIKNDLHDLDRTVETIINSGEVGVGPYTMVYREGSGFWADGANVPHNYISGYVDGILAYGCKVEETQARAAALMSNLIVDEDLMEFPEIWNYWGGVGFHGWDEEDLISSNTPEYDGSRIEAHISYRSMDAMALIKLFQCSENAVPESLIDHISVLVGRGNLRPFVNEYLMEIGKKADINQSVLYRYARSKSSHEIESQVWALEALVSSDGF